MTKTFSRRELYDLVWAEPMKTVAETVGVSDVALAKACRGADIPVPERGYWAKLRAGKAIPRACPGEMAVDPDALQRWAVWVLAEADRIDPLLNGSISRDVYEEVTTNPSAFRLGGAAR